MDERQVRALIAKLDSIDTLAWQLGFAHPHVGAIRAWTQEIRESLLSTPPQAAEGKQPCDCKEAERCMVEYGRARGWKEPQLSATYFCKRAQFLGDSGKHPTPPQAAEGKRFIGHCGDCGGTEFALVERCLNCECEEQVDRYEGGAEAPAPREAQEDEDE